MLISFQKFEDMQWGNLIDNSNNTKKRDHFLPQNWAEMFENDRKNIIFD